MIHEKFMREALIEAQKAFELNEVPVGAVVVSEGEIIGRGHNTRNTNKNPLCHGEITAINEAASVIGDWRLEGCVLYATVEPCPMCAGAIVTARMSTVVFGARNEKAGCCGSILNILQQPRFNHQVEIVDGVLVEECSELMSRFFRRLREV